MDSPPAPPAPPVTERRLAATLARLKQQELQSYTCTFSPRSVISLYFIIAFVFVPLGSAVVAGTANIASTRGHITYSDLGECKEPFAGDQTCIVKFNVTKAIDPPSYLYYSLTNFHQNARKYAKSRSDVMNQGKVPKSSFDVTNCQPLLFSDSNLEDGPFDPSEFLYPCGLTAQSEFNDTFSLCRDSSCTSEINVSRTGIAWWTDTKHKFNAGPLPLFEDANEKLESEPFVVWMRLSAFSSFDKLYGVVQERLEPEKVYFMKINSNFPVESLGGSKAFFITTTKWFGARNVFLGTAYIIVGITALFIACTLLFKHVLNPKSQLESDPSMLLRQHLEALNADPSDPLRTD